MTSFEEIPDGNWVLRKFPDGDILFYSTNLDEVIKELETKYDEEEVYVEPKNVLNARG